MSASFQLSSDGRWFSVDVPLGEGLPLGIPGELRALMCTAQIGRYTFTLVCGIGPDGQIMAASDWKPERPKRLKPRHLKEYRRRRLEFASMAAKAFHQDVQVIDRMGGKPVVTELCYSDGEVERLDSPLPYLGPVLH